MTTHEHHSLAPLVAPETDKVTFALLTNPYLLRNMTDKWVTAIHGVDAASFSPEMALTREYIHDAALSRACNLWIGVKESPSEGYAFDSDNAVAYCLTVRGYKSDTYEVQPEETPFILGTAVKPTWRNRGIGTAIRETALSSHFEFQGDQEVRTTVREDNLPMMAINRAMGARILRNLGSIYEDGAPRLELSLTQDSWKNYLHEQGRAASSGSCPKCGNEDGHIVRSLAREGLNILGSV